jgi:ribonuclease HI
MIDVLQWNAGRGLGRKEGKVLLRKMCVERGARVCLLQEMMGPGGTKFETNRQWTPFQSGRAAVLVAQGIRASVNETWMRQSDEDGSGLDAAAVDIAGIPGHDGAVLIISVYRDQLEDPHLLMEYLREVLLQEPAVNVVVGGDFNIHSTAVGGKRNGPAGAELAELIAQLVDTGGGCANTGAATWKDRPAAAAARKESHIDVTLFSTSAASKIELKEWEVGEQETSDHVTIHFKIGGTDRISPETPDYAEPVQTSSVPDNWCRLIKGKCTPDRLAHMAELAEQTAQLHREKPEQAGSSAIEFADRVLEEIQSAAKEAGIIKSWETQQQQRSTHVVYGWSEECADARRRRERARRKMRRPTATEDEVNEQRQEWKFQTKRLQTAVREAAEAEWNKFCAEIDVDTQPQEMWRRIKRLTRSGKGQKGAATPMMRGEDGEPIVTARGQAQHLTDHWAARSSMDHPSNAGFSESEKDRLETEYEAICATLRLPEEIESENKEYNAKFQNWELEKIIDGLPKGKAPGWDGIPYEIIAALGQGMRDRLLQAINGLWTTGGVPDQWREAILIGIPKKETPLKGEDFRPVSLLISICKLAEAMIKGRLQWIVDGKHKALPPCDLGFRKNANAQQQVLRATQAAHEAWSRKKDLVLIQLDQDKAFDTMWGIGLVIKLFRFGVRGRLLRWITQYMRPGRRGRTTLEGVVSEPKEWDLGIGQGGVLGPLLFIIFFSDFPISPETGGKYADDSELWMELSRASADREAQLEELQGKLDAIDKWGKTWRMQTSASKTSIILLTPAKRRQHMMDNPLHLHMDGQELSQTMTGGVRMLGVWLDPHLKFDMHITKLTARGWHRVQSLRQIAGLRRGVSRATITHLYESWIRPVMEYGSTSYAGASKQQLARLDKVQAAALRIIVGTTQTASVEALHWETGIQHLATRRLQEAATAASTLRRTRPDANSAAAEYQRWSELPGSDDGADRLVRATKPSTAYVKTGGRMSPFEILRGAYRLLEVEQWDPTTELRDASAGGFLIPPWEPPQAKIPRHWPTFDPASSRSEEAQRRAREYGQRRVAEVYKEAADEGKTVIMAFTDGSADPIRGGGGAAVIWVDTARATPRTDVKEIGHIATSFMAEGEALLLALRGIPEAIGARDPETTRVQIWSDCQPAIRLVEEGRTGPDLSYWQTALTAKNILEQLKEKDIETRVDWIPAHCGLTHNESADREATAAAEACRTKGTIGTSVPRPHRVVRAFVRRKVNEQELRWYQDSDKARRPQKLNPLCRPRDILPALRSAKLGRLMESCIGRLRVGNETGPRARIRMGMATDMQCRWCEDDDGTEHRLFDCPWITLRKARETAKGRLAKINKGRYSFSLATLVGLWGVLKADQAAVLMILANMIREVPGLMEGFMETRRVIRPRSVKARGAKKPDVGKPRVPRRSNRAQRKPKATPAFEPGQQLLTRYWGAAFTPSGRVLAQEPDSPGSPGTEPDSPPAPPRRLHPHRKCKDPSQPLGNEHLTQIQPEEYREWLADTEDLLTTRRRLTYRMPRGQAHWWSTPTDVIMSDQLQDWWDQRMQTVGAAPRFDDSGG